MLSLRLLNSALVGSLVLLAACSAEVAETNPQTQNEPAAPAVEMPKDVAPTPALHDAEIEAWKLDLLDLAFEAASRFPMNPHHKNRARAQAEAVQAMIKHGALGRALTAIETVEGWQKGVLLADVAHALATHGETKKKLASDLIARAMLLATVDPEDPDAQEWRADRVRAHVARAWFALGDLERAEAQSAQVTGVEAGVFLKEQAASMPVDQIPALVEAVRQATATADFDRSRSDMDLLVTLHARPDVDANVVRDIETLLRSGFRTVPADVRIRAMLAAAKAAHESGRTAGAQDLWAAARDLHALAQWRPQDDAPLRAELAGVQALVQDREAALSALTSVRAMLREERPRIYDVFRADALRPVAVAYATAGATESALEVFRLALEEGAMNPNARPRTDDLVNTLCAMVAHNVAPSARMRARMGQIAEGLVAPW